MIPYHLRSFIGGVSDFEDKGIAGSFKAGSKSLDVRKAIDSLTCQQGLTDDLEPGTMTELPIVTIAASNNETYFFLRNGDIYRRNSAGNYLLVWQDPEGIITGAAEWYDQYGNRFLYWATYTKLHRKRIYGVFVDHEPWTDVDAAAVTGTGATSGDPWPKTNLDNAPWHTMRVCTGTLQIANNNKLALVGYDNSYTPEALQLQPGTVAKCLIERNVYCIVGAYRLDWRDESMLYVWDTNSLDYNQKTPIPLSAINAMIDTEIALMQVGTNGQLYISDPNTIMPILSIPGGGRCFVDGVTGDRGMALFGIFGNSAGYNGIWSYGRLDKQHSVVLNYEYPLDCDEIGSITKVGTDIFISYRHGTDYGVKKVDLANKADAEYHTLDLVAPIGSRRYSIPLGRQLLWGHATLGMSDLPEGCGVEFWYRLDKKATQYELPNGTLTDVNGWRQANLTDGAATTRLTIAGTREVVFQIGEKARVFEGLVKLFPHGNDTPEIHEVNVYFDVG